MAFFDLPEEELIHYKPVREEPEDFDKFWEDTLSEASSVPIGVVFKEVDYGLSMLETYDVTFKGYGGHEIKGWFLLPRYREGKIPCVVEYIGYGGGRSFPAEWLVWSSAGYSHFIMDTRGQGSSWQLGDTPDPDQASANPHYPGFMTQGILQPQTYYYRRLITDAVRAVEAARSHEAVDDERIAICGRSQGGGITLAVAGLEKTVKAAMPEVPFLCHYRRATEISDAMPYYEISKFLKVHRNKVEQVFRTLSYFDGLNFAVRSGADALFSVGLMDEICPPSTVFAAYNHYAGKKDIRIWRYNEHDGGGGHQIVDNIRFLKALFG